MGANAQSKEQFRRQVANKLDDYSFFASASRFSERHYTSQRLASLFDVLVDGFAGARMLEKGFDDIVEGEVKEKQQIILYELGKSVTKGIGGLATVNLEGKKSKSKIDANATCQKTIDVFVNEYRSAIKEGIITNEQHLINYTAEFFDTLVKGTNSSLPGYTMQEDVFGTHQSMSVQKSDKHVDTATKSKPTHNFSDVMGLNDQKDRARKRLIKPIKYAEAWQALKRVPEKIKDNYNFIFHGPPGTGKTYFAQSIAGELNVPFFSVVGSDFIQSLHGEGKNKLAKMYEQANSYDAAVVFIDEADTICYKRGSREAELKSDVTTEFLTTLDGIKNTGKVATILSTNIIEEFDRAIVDRFPSDNIIYFGALGKNEQLKIFEYQVGLYEHEGISRQDLENIIDGLPDVNPRAVKHITQSAAFETLDQGLKKIAKKQLERALDSYKQRGW